MLRVKGLCLSETISALCRGGVKQTCKPPVSNYHILTAPAQTHGHNSFHFILTSTSNKVSIKRAGYKTKLHPKQPNLHTPSQKQHLCLLTFRPYHVNVPVYWPHLLKVKKNKSKNNQNNTNLLTKNILTKGLFVFCCCCFVCLFVSNVCEDMLLLDMIPKTNILLEYLTVHKSIQDFCCLLGGQNWQKKKNSQWNSIA